VTRRSTGSIVFKIVKNLTFSFKNVHYLGTTKTPLRSRLTQRNLEALMRISMEGKDKLSNSNLDTLVDKFKNKKDRYMML
jgi:hypothetical protein